MQALHSDLAPHCFVAVHAELRVPGTDDWDSGCPSVQPFKSLVDAVLQAVYFHKDSAADFYGEVWNYDDEFIMLRQETFPLWPPPFDPPSAPWDARPDKFRLFADGGGGDASSLPGGRGRILAPVAFDNAAASRWSYSGVMSTYLCRDWADFGGGNCTSFQPNFLDANVSVRGVDGDAFSTVFDGEPIDPQWAADAAMRDLVGSSVRVVDQQMAGGGGGTAAVSRERFFFAQARNGTNLGIVRWDASAANASAPDGFTVVQRTVGLRVECDDGFNSSGFEDRRRHDVASSSSRRGV
jgi:hypothetical protein